MAGLFAYALGGALQGFGGGLKEQAIAKREAALAELANQRLAQREEADRAFRREEGERSRLFEAEQNRMNREFQLDSRQGDLIDMGDGKFGVRKGSTVEPLVDAEGNPAAVNKKAGRWMTAEEKQAAGVDQKSSIWIEADGTPKSVGGSGTTINMGEGSGEYRKALDKKLAEQSIAIQEGAQQARSKLATLDALGDALAKSGQTGWGAETLLTVQQAGNALGMNIGDNLDAKEAARALGNQLALQLRNPSSGAGMPGAMSDKDREFLVASVPGLTKTPAGNTRLIEFMKKIERRNIDVAGLAQRYEAKQGQLDNGFFKELGEWADANPLFTDMPQPGDIVDGYRFIGGDPGAKTSWQKVQ